MWSNTVFAAVQSNLSSLDSAPTGVWLQALWLPRCLILRVGTLSREVSVTYRRKQNTALFKLVVQKCWIVFSSLENTGFLSSVHYLHRRQYGSYIYFHEDSDLACNPFSQLHYSKCAFQGKIGPHSTFEPRSLKPAEKAVCYFCCRWYMSLHSSYHRYRLSCFIKGAESFAQILRLTA